MTPTEPEDAGIADPAEDMPAPDQQPSDTVATTPDGAPVPEEEETSEQFMRRLVEENSWRMKPRPPRPVPPPESKSIHLMTPEEMHDSLPVHLRRRRPDGGYYAMGLISRMQTDLAELTQGKRAATYLEVDEYLGYALLAEGLAPRRLTAPDAVKWWRSGGSDVLRETVEKNGSAAKASDDSAPRDVSDMVDRGWESSSIHGQPREMEGPDARHRSTEEHTPIAPIEAGYFRYLGETKSPPGAQAGAGAATNLNSPAKRAERGDNQILRTAVKDKDSVGAIVKQQ